VFIEAGADSVSVHQEACPHLDRTLRLIQSEGALAVLAPGGRLVYATCSLEREENEEVVNQFADRVQEQGYRLPGREAGDGFFHAVLA